MGRVWSARQGWAWIASGAPARVILLVVAGLLAALVVLGVALAAFVYFGGDPAIRGFLQRQGTAFLDRKFTLGPSFHVVWGSPIRIEGENVRIANAAGFTSPNLLTARRVEVDLDTHALLHLRLRYPRVVLSGATLAIETSKTGVSNWPFAAAAVTPQRRTEFPDIESLDITDGSFSWHSGVSGATTLLTFTHLAAKAASTTSPIALSAAGNFQREPYALTAGIGPLAQLWNAAEPYPVRLSGTLAGTRVAIAGRLAHPLDFTGIDANIDIAGADLQTFFKIFSVPVPQTPAYRLSGRLTHGPDSGSPSSKGAEGADDWVIHDLKGELGRSRVAGTILVDASGRLPYIRTTLSSPYMDLADFKGFYGGSPSAAEAAASAAERRRHPDARTIPATPIPLDRLTGFNADVSFEGHEIKRTAGVPFERVKLILSLKNGTLRIDPLTFAIAGGTIASHLVLVATERPPHFQGDIAVRHINLGELLRETQTARDVRETQGIFGGDADFVSVGDSPRALLGGMNGQFGFFMEGGRVSALIVDLFGLDIFHAVLTYAEGDHPVPIDCVATRFVARNGIATATTFLVDTAKSTILGQGNIDFKDETVDMRFVPRAKHFSPLALHAPILVRGPLSNPTARPITRDLLTQLGAAIGLGVVAGPAAALPLIDWGAERSGACARAFAAQPRR
jgi:uncharacterized protein involved in outer membrane biogenesis